MTRTAFFPAVGHAPEEKERELGRLTGALRTKGMPRGLTPSLSRMDD